MSDTRSPASDITDDANTVSGEPQRSRKRDNLKPRSAPVQGRSIKRSKEILDATGELLERVGMHDLTTNVIAREVGISVGSLYHYFPNKHAILYAMVVSNRERRWIYLGCAVAIAVPFGLELAGVTHAYADTAEGIAILAPALGGGVTAMLMLGFLSTLLPVMAAIFAICVFRDALGRAEREVILRDWHLRQMVGGEPPSSRRFPTQPPRS